MSVERYFVIFVKGTTHEREFDIMSDSEFGAVESAKEYFNETFPDDTALETDIYSDTKIDVGYQVKDLNVSLSEILKNDPTTFSDLLEELFLAEYEEEVRGVLTLGNLHYKAIDVNPYGQIVMEVSAEVTQK